MYLSCAINPTRQSPEMNVLHFKTNYCSCELCASKQRTEWTRFFIFCYFTVPPWFSQGGGLVRAAMDPDGICHIDPPDGLAGWSEVIDKIQEVSRCSASTRGV